MNKFFTLKFKFPLHLGLILIIALFFRIWLLDLFPISMLYDELNYVMNAKSLYHTHQNIPLTASALLSWGETNFDVVISEIPSYLIMFWVGPTPLSQFNARFLYALASVLSVLLVYLITKNLLNEEIAKFAGFLMAVNPWSIHLGRIALEASFSTFFFLLGIYLILSKNSWKILFALPFFAAGFLSYLGAKLLFLPIITTVLFYKFKTSQTKNSASPYIIFGLVALLFLLLYSLTINNQPAGSRTKELLIFDQSWATEIVNQERRQAIPNFALPIFVNKLTVTLKRVSDVYLGAFSSTNLFAKGETIAVYSIWDYGQLHHLDFPLIVFGLVSLFIIKRSVFWLILAIVVIAPSVSAIDLVEKTYGIRSFPMFPFLVILAAIGFWSIGQITKYGKLLMVALIIFYLMGVLYFAHLYFFRYPIYSAERWFFSSRIIANYIKHVQQDPNIKKIYVVTQESSKVVFEHYLFYGGIYQSRGNILKANQNLRLRNFSYDKAQFLNDCPKNVDFNGGEILIVDVRTKCIEDEKDKVGTVSLADAGTTFLIEGDKLCQNMELPRYYRPMNLSDFYLEKMSREEFCKRWIVRF